MLILLIVILRIMPRFDLLWTLLFSLFLFSLTSCMGDDPHFEKAVKKERAILRRYTDVDYSMKEYLKVAKELDMVSPLSKDFKEARRILSEIAKARLMALHRNDDMRYLPGGVHDKVLKREMGEPYPGKKKGKGKKERIEEEISVKNRNGEVDGPAKPPSIILYTTAWCPYCEKTRRFFKNRGLPFVEKDVEKSTSSMLEMHRKAGFSSGVPVIDIEGEIIVGYDEEKLSKIIGRSRGG